MQNFLVTFVAGFVTGICFCRVMEQVSFFVIRLKNVLEVMFHHWVHINPLVLGVH